MGDGKKEQTKLEQMQEGSESGRERTAVSCTPQDGEVEGSSDS